MGKKEIELISKTVSVLNSVDYERYSKGVCMRYSLLKSDTLYSEVMMDIVSRL